MIIDAATIDRDEAYKLLIGAVVPRPIAWVTTLNRLGKVNAAPFSCYTFVSSAPPMLAISVGRLRGELKDTARNARDGGDFVVNVADASQVGPLHQSSAEYPEDVSEIEVLGLETIPSIAVRTPRIAIAPVAMECRFDRIIEFGAQRSQLLVGEVLRFHVRDDLYRDGKIDSVALSPLGRLGGPRYTTLGKVITMPPVSADPPVTVAKL